MSSARTHAHSHSKNKASQFGSRASGSEKMGLPSHSGPVPCQKGIEGERVGGEKGDGNISAHRGPPVKASRKSTQCLLSVPPYTSMKKRSLFRRQSDVLFRVSRHYLPRDGSAFVTCLLPLLRIVYTIMLVLTGKNSSVAAALHVLSMCAD